MILQEEINPFLTALRRRGIIVTAVHNHWLFENPRLMYMHWEYIGNPFEFARNSFDAAKEADIFYSVSNRNYFMKGLRIR